MDKTILISLLKKTREAVFSVLPVSAAALAVSLVPGAGIDVRTAVIFCVCTLLMIVGIAVFNLGADMSMMPMGERVGSGLTKTGKVTLLFGACFVLGLLITVAEPDLSVLASQASSVINGRVLVFAVGAGVAFCLTVGANVITGRQNLIRLLLFFYMAVFSFCAVLAENGRSTLLPLVFDSGGVTTGPVSVPFLMALGVGIASAAGGDSRRDNSFGLISLCSVGPLFALAALFIFSDGSPAYSLPPYSVAEGPGTFFSELGSVSLDLLVSIGLIIAFFTALQLTVLRLHRAELLRMGIGIVYTFVGLAVFLTAVNVGYMPVGFKIGGLLAGLPRPAIAATGVMLGAMTVLAEPAVHVLTKQVEDVTGGLVSRRAVRIGLAAGVGISIALSFIRIIYGFSVLWYLIPGYILSFALSFFVPGIYSAIAFDSGGVASGPLTSSFILPVAVGLCAALRGESDVLRCAFGTVAVVAMTPLITVQTLGFRSVVSAAVRRRIVMRRILGSDDEQIIYFGQRKKENEE